MVYLSNCIFNFDSSYPQTIVGKTASLLTIFLHPKHIPENETVKGLFKVLAFEFDPPGWHIMQTFLWPYADGC